MPASSLTHPSPQFHAVIRALGMAYLFFNVFLAFLTKEQTQAFLREFVDGSLGAPLPDKHYAEDCSFLTG